MRFLNYILFLLLTTAMHGQDLYINTFGDSTDHPVIYLHGGPVGHSLKFEEIAAEKLAEAGFYVIVYDRRGIGRSQDIPKRYYTLKESMTFNKNHTFAQIFTDIDYIIDRYELEAPTLLGFSFGGIIATIYAEHYPDQISSIVLMSMPISFEKMNNHIYEQAKKAYAAKADSVNIGNLEWLKSADSTLENSFGLLLFHAAQSGIMQSPSMNEEAQQIKTKNEQDSLNKRSQKINSAGTGFGYSVEIDYESIDFLESVKKLKNDRIEIFAIYGKNDFRYANEHIEQLKEVIGDQNVLYLENAGHTVFFYQRTAFINALKNWLK